MDSDLLGTHFQWRHWPAGHSLPMETLTCWALISSGDTDLWTLISSRDTDLWALISNGGAELLCTPPASAGREGHPQNGRQTISLSTTYSLTEDSTDKTMPTLKQKYYNSVYKRYHWRLWIAPFDTPSNNSDCFHLQNVCGQCPSAHLSPLSTVTTDAWANPPYLLFMGNILIN